MDRIIAANILTCFLIISQIITAYVVSVYGENMGAFATSLPGLLMLNQLLAVFLPTVIFAFIICKKTGDTLTDFFKINPITGKNIMLVILMSIVIQPMMGVLSLFSSLFFENDVSDIAFNMFGETSFLVMVLAMAVTPAVFEELAVRGAVLSSYGKKLGLKRTLLINGLFFGIIHLNGQQFLYAIALGVFLGYIVHVTNSIFASIIAHFTINFTQITLMSLILSVLNNPAYEEIIAANDVSAHEAAEYLNVSVLSTVFLYSFIAYLIFKKLLKSFKKNNNAFGIFVETECETDETFETADCSVDDLSARLTMEIKKVKYNSIMFYASFFTVIFIFMAIMTYPAITMSQILFLLVSFAIFFLVFFLFRVRG